MTDATAGDVAVWFDLDGTLVQFERGFDRLVSDALVAAGLRSPPEDAYDAFAERVFAALEECADDPYERAFAETAEVLRLDVDASEAAEAYRELALEATSVPDGARETVEAVAERAPTGLLTNGDGAFQRALLEHHDLADAFDAIVISNEEGVRKPDPELFAVAAEQIDADEHVYVADEFETDVGPAERAGWQAVHVRNDAGPSISVDEIGSLRALLL